MDDVTTIALSTWTIVPGEWNVLLSTNAIWVGPSFVNVKIDSAMVHVAISTTPVNVWDWDYVNSTQTFSQMNIQDYTNLVIRETQMEDIFSVIGNMTEYMVWPDTTTFPDSSDPWDGWCMEIINKRKVPVPCP